MKTLSTIFAIICTLIIVIIAAAMPFIISWLFLEPKEAKTIRKEPRTTGFQISDDVDEFSIHYNKIHGYPQPKPKYYKRIDGIIKEVKPPK